MRFPWSSTSRRAQHKALLQVPFVGQAAVLAALASHVQTAQHGTVQFATLTGQAGSGKSALLEEFLFLYCTTPGVLLLQLNAAACLREYEFYRQLCAALQTRGEHILQTVYNATKRVRKTLALHWDEAEFRQVLASTDWAQLHETSPTRQSMAGRASTPVAQLLASVQEHPWAIGAAAMLGVMGRGVTGSTPQRLWAQRWAVSLRTLHARYRPGEAVMVLAIDQLPPGAPFDWHAFATVTAATQLPLLVIWAGTADSLEPVHQALQGRIPVTQCQLEQLSSAEHQHLLRQALRHRSRAVQTSWQRALATADTATWSPGWLLLATTCAAAMAETSGPGVDSFAALAQADTTTLVSQLVDSIRQRYPAQAPLFRQLLEACAFMPPGTQFVVDDLLPLCDFAGLDLDAVAGRTNLETLLGQCVR